MQRLIELFLGLPRDVLAQRGEFSLTFDPIWPFAAWIPAVVWNAVLAAAILGLILYVYRRENASRRFRIISGCLRIVLLALLLAVLNRPMISLTQTRTEPSVLAILIDDSLSMQVGDMPGAAGGKTISRLEAIKKLLTEPLALLLEKLAATHQLRLYHFSGSALPMASIDSPQGVSSVAEQIRQLKPSGNSTRVIHSIEQVAQQLQGQHLAGIVVLTDGREMPVGSTDAASLRSLGARIYPVCTGTEARIRNLAIDTVSAQDVAFKGDLVNVKVKMTITGAEKSEAVRLTLKRTDGTALTGPDGREVVATVYPDADGSYTTDLVFKAEKPGVMDLVVQAADLPGEITLDDNSRTLQVAVLDTQVNLLYVDGYPRWEFRYLKTQIMRDKTVQISTLLTSADAGYVQEGTIPIRFFPQTLDQLLQYDVVLFGDLDPRQFTDAQLRLVRDFVMIKGGGFGMIAGPRYSPQAWRGTPIDAILPVDISNAHEDETPVEPFRPVLTAEGQDSPMFRFFADRATNEKYIREQLPPLYWFARGVTPRPAISEVYAEHPTLTAPDGRHAPLMVVGRPGAGRTLFSAIDDSWRWRFYTGESIFDTYWIQQIRYLARGRKVGQRRLAFTSVRPVYEAGEQAQLELRVVDDQLGVQLPDAIGVEVMDADGKLVARENLQRQPTRKDIYRLLLPVGEVGRFTARLPSVAAGMETLQAPFDVIVPRLELSDPRPARSALSQYAAQTDGSMIDFAKAATQLVAIPSAARIVPVQTTWPIWASPLLLGAIVLLLTAEWIYRKFAGLV